MKTLNDQAKNEVTIVGKLLDATFGSGKTKNGAPYERANLTIRVKQTYGGKEEVSEIPVSMFATQFTTKGGVNPAYQSIQNVRKLKTAQEYGIDGADTVRISASAGRIRENNFVSKNSGQVVYNWSIDGSFVNEGKTADVATFCMEIFIMNITDEVDREGELTGRLNIKGAVVQYGGRLDVLNFVVENPEAVEFIRDNWQVNDTNCVVGRIRVASIEEKQSGSHSSWGEDIPEVSTRTIKELVITKGDDEGRPEEFAYDPTEIKKGYNARLAQIEQMQIDAKKVTTATASTGSASTKYDWE